MRLVSKLLTAVVTTLSAFSAQATTVPFGVQNDVSSATVASWGFTQCFSATYGQLGLTTQGMLSNCSGDYLMLAARRTGSSVFEVLAAADFADAIFNTGTGNTTHSANGAEWYFSDDWSWGFAGASDSVSRNSCDTAGFGERDRLCWHTHVSYSGGWRAGSFTGLNSDNGWEKVLLVANSGGGNVPEPASLALVGLGLVGASAARRSLKKRA